VSDGLAGISLQSLIELVHVDQARRWARGEQPLVEDYLQCYPQLRQSHDAVVALLHREFHLRRQAGQQPDLDTFAARFPDHIHLLRGLLDLQQRLAEDLLTPGVQAPAPSAAGDAHETIPPTGVHEPITGAEFAAGEAPPTRVSVTPTPGIADGGPGIPLLPGYTILGVLGKGGMGIVYKAQQTALKRVVALKMILHGSYADDAERRRFVTEAETIARLQHPHVVQVFDVGEHDSMPYFSLEYCPGGSLQKLLDGTPWEPKRAAAMVESMARAVDAAHQAGLVHRDLKPGNILLTEEGTPKIADFGLVKRLDTGGDTQSGVLMGTPEYMAPEQASGKSREVGPAADTYALGAILYELLTGKPPFRAATLGETVYLVLRVEPVPVRRLQPQTPKDIDTICLKCLQKLPAKRYASALDLADDLRRFMNLEPIHARPTGPGERTLKLIRRRPAVAALLAMVVVVTAVGIGAFAWAYGQALRKEKDASDRLAEMKAEQQQRVLAQVGQLQSAAPEAVPGILADLAREPELVRSRLQELWQDEKQPRQQRMRVGLALAAAEPEKVKQPLLAWLLEEKDPREVKLARDALKDHAGELKADLWQRVANKETAAAIRFRALVALAAFDREGEGWKTAGEAAVTQLLEANPLYLGTWTETLRPASAALVEPLGVVFRGKKLPERRLVAANVLAEYLGNDPKAVADLAADADAEQLAVLRPLLDRHREQVVQLLEAELKPLTATWKDAPLDPAWDQPDDKLVQEIERVGGLVTERFALCQTLPLQRVLAVVDALQKCGYRPMRLRPYRHGDQVQAALVWTRDGVGLRREVGLTEAALKTTNTEREREGFVAVDVAGYREAADGKTIRYAALWRKAEKGDEATLLLGLPEVGFFGSQPWRDAHEAAKKKGFAVPGTVQMLPRANDRPLLSGLRYKGVMKLGAGWPPDSEAVARVAFPDRLAVDVDLGEVVGWAPYERAGMVGGLAGPGLGGLAALPWARLGPMEDRWYATVFHERPGWEAERVLGLTPQEQVARMRELAVQGWRPAALSVAEVSQGWWGTAPLRTASLWHRPAVMEADRVARAPRQANAAALLLALHREEPVWPLLKGTPTPDVRSHLLARLGTHGIGSAAIVKRLETEPEVTARRALILGLGEYGEKELPLVDRQRLLPVLLGWYREDPDPGIHGAIDWLLRHGKEGRADRKLDWGGARKLEEIDRELRGKPPEKRRWVVNSQGQTFALIPGPVEFLMGTPVDEPQRFAANEAQHLRKIGRSFAIATKVVSVAEFEQFLKENPTVTHGEPNQYNPDAGCPRIEVSWFDAAQYCRWLSEKEGVLEKEMCYPSIAEIEKSKDGITPLVLPRGYLERTGYRLPMEAEWEYACRAETKTAWSFGGSEELLDRHGWYLKNAGDRTWPVGQKRPNDFGLFDMHGNVWQWCQGLSWQYANPIIEDKEDIEYNRDIKDITDRYNRILHGGAFGFQSVELRAGNRNYSRPSIRTGSMGFRPARTYH
jgi:formylglycine-generating enzyme required for sulfatase activity/tRNA A-37 threonylcarbamoyl transferase component Bud32